MIKVGTYDVVSRNNRYELLNTSTGVKKKITKDEFDYISCGKDQLICCKTVDLIWNK